MSKTLITFDQFMEQQRKSGNPVSSLDIWQAALAVAKKITQDVQADYKQDEGSSGYEAAGVIRRKIEQYIKSNMITTVKCEDCGKPYTDFPLDVVLSNEQWELITGYKEEGILCAACIVERGKRLHLFSVAKLVFE